MFGYETWVTLNGIFIPCQSADTDLDRARIDSSGIYGGSLAGTNSPIGQVHYYDWPNVTANFSAEASEDVLALTKSMILNRNTPLEVIINDGLSGMQKIERAWWNQISVQTSEDSLVGVSMSFSAIERERFDVNEFSAYWLNQDGSYANDCANFSDISRFGYFPIPFWNTKISEFEYVKNWNVTITQDVLRFLGCMNYSGSEPKSPFALGVGIMNGTLSFSTFDNNTAQITAMPTKYSGSSLNSRQPLSLMIAGNTFLNLEGELNKISDPLNSTSAISEISYEYQIYGIS